MVWVARNNLWLYKQLNGIADLEFLHGDPLLKVRYKDRSKSIYAPDSSEYLITQDLVERIHELGGDLISYPTKWVQVSKEAHGFARDIGFEIWPHGKTISYFQDQAD
jgi:hypothetical protein